MKSVKERFVEYLGNKNLSFGPLGRRPAENVEEYHNSLGTRYDGGQAWVLCIMTHRA